MIWLEYSSVSFWKRGCAKSKLGDHKGAHNDFVQFGFHLFDQSSEFINYNNNVADKIFVDEFLSTAFTEIDLRLFKKIALNTGFRYEHSELLEKTRIAPRLSAAYKISKNSQMSYAYGKYYQTPDIGFDLWYRQNNINLGSDFSHLGFEESTHNILNYEWSHKGKMIRFEIFDKQYDNLILL